LNADANRDAVFKASTRQLSPDLADASEEHASRDLGHVDAAQLTSLLEKLAALSPDKLIDADPHLVVSGRRGRFIVRPARGKLRLCDANDATRDALEIGPAEVANYLDGSELRAVAVAVEISDRAPDANNTRLGLVLALLLLSVGMVTGSAFFTFKPGAIDEDVDYTVPSTEQASTWRQQFNGVFATGSGDGSRLLTLRPDGTVKFVEHGPNQVVLDERLDTYRLALRGTTPVARTPWLGPIDLRDARTLFYAGETYTRIP
jgi:hypothetical protein